MVGELARISAERPRRFRAGAAGVFPLRLRRQPVVLPLLEPSPAAFQRCQLAAEGDRVVPVDIHRRRVISIDDTPLPLPGLRLHHRLPLGLGDDRAADEERMMDRDALFRFVGAAPLLRHRAPHREAAGGDRHELHSHRVDAGPAGDGPARRCCCGGLLRGGFRPRRDLLRRSLLAGRGCGWGGRLPGRRRLRGGRFLEGHRVAPEWGGQPHFNRSPAGTQPPPPDHSSSMWRRCMTRWTNGATTSDATPMKRSPEKRA